MPKLPLLIRKNTYLATYLPEDKMWVKELQTTASTDFTLIEMNQGQDRLQAWLAPQNREFC